MCPMHVPKEITHVHILTILRNTFIIKVEVLLHVCNLTKSYTVYYLINCIYVCYGDMRYETDHIK